MPFFIRFLPFVLLLLTAISAPASAGSNSVSQPTFAAGQATSLPVQNPSFEQDKLESNDSPGAWVSDAPYRHALDTGYVVANHGYQLTADGKNYLEIVCGHAESQVVPRSTYAPLEGDIVTLTVAVGPNSEQRVGSIALTLNDEIVAKNIPLTTPPAKYPNFNDASTSRLITAADTGKTLGIRLIDQPKGVHGTHDDVIDFDHVRLSVTRGGTPSANIANELAACAVAPTPKKERKGLRVYSCGHSYHFLNYSLPELLQEMAFAAGYPDHEIVGESVIFGSKIINHWNGGDKDSRVKDALGAGAADVLTLAPLYLPDEGIGYISEFAFEHNPKIHITVQELWLPFDANNRHHFDPPLQPRPATDHNAATVASLTAIHQAYFQDMDSLVTELNRKMGRPVISVVPVGQAVIALRGKIIAGKCPGVKTQEELFADQLGHPGPVIQTLVGYCHFAVIYGKNPAGLPIPSTLAKSKVAASDQPELNRLLQQLAWDAVTHHPLSGVTPS